MKNAADDDDDYFASLPSTSLANVFTKINIGDTTSENTSLNYIPVKPKQESLSYETKCVFTRFFTAFEWSNSNYYTPKGKVGLAVIKDIQNDSYNILIYDASKSPLSYINVTPAFNVKVKNTEYIFFYDHAEIYWMLHSNCNDIEETVNMFKKLGVSVANVNENDKELEPQIDNDLHTTDIVSTNVNNKDSDTDSSANQQNKAAILKRMANMGQAILPPSKIAKSPTNDSSSDNGKPIIKPLHKPSKSKLITKYYLNAMKEISCNNHEETTKVDLTNNSQMNTANSGILNQPQNDDLLTLMAEQRLTNSELRINLGRISDKVDAAIQNIIDLRQNSNMEFLVEVYRKLLNEYESKIKALEESRSKELDSTTIPKLLDDQAPTTSNSNPYVIRNLEAEIVNLRRTIQEKETQIFNLETEIKNISLDRKKGENDNNLITQIDELKQMIKNINVDVQPEIHKEIYTQQQVKEMMNEMYHSVSLQLEDNLNYTGEDLKKLVGTSIKKATFELLNLK